MAGGIRFATHTNVLNVHQITIVPTINFVVLETIVGPIQRQRTLFGSMKSGLSNKMKGIENSNKNLISLTRRQLNLLRIGNLR